MGKRTVRVIRTWEIRVDARPGEDETTLAGKVTAKNLERAPDGETRVLLPDEEG